MMHFFSKGESKINEIRERVEQEKSTPKGATSVRTKTGKVGSKVDDVAQGKRIIEDLSAVPVGRFRHFAEDDLDVPASFIESYIVLEVDAHTAYLIAAEDAFASHAMWELHRRLRANGWDEIRLLQAKREIVLAVQSQHKNMARDGDKSTDVEDKAWEMINNAVSVGASDIHIETRTNFAQVFFRIHGERIEQPNMSKETAQNICGVLFNVHADSQNKETYWDMSKVQDTVIDHAALIKDKKGASGRVQVQLRFNSAPIHPGGNFHCVIRILRMDSSSAAAIEEVGYSPAQCQAIEQMLIGSTGLVLLVGPTNSGKSTSLQAFIRRIYEHRGPTVKVITVEDPVEYVIDRACQMGVPKGRKMLEDKDGSIYRTYLKGTLRQDPDVVMVGEIRDAESAAAVKDLVLAGRKILTTLHAYEAMAVYPRLREIGVPESLLNMHGFISGIIYQRLVPTLCPHCGIPVEEAFKNGLVNRALFDRVLRVSDTQEDDVRVRNTDGCEHCNYTGIVGRTPCAEILVPDEVFLSHMRAGNELAARAHWFDNKELNIGGLGITAIAHAIQKMNDGHIDPRDIEVQIGIIRPPHLTQFPSAEAVTSTAGYRRTL